MRQVFTALEDAFPAMRSYTDVQRERTAEDLAHIVDFLATALYLDDEELFTRFITWTARILVARGVPAASLPPTLDLLARELKDFSRAVRIIGAGTRALSTDHSTAAGNPA